MKNPILIALITLVIGAGAGFFGGMQYQLSKTRSLTGNRQFTGNGNFPGRNGNGARAGFTPVNGSIVSADDKSLTVKLTDGSSKLVILSATTQINKAATASAADLQVGDKVAVFGQTNSDGSVTAQSVQLNPIIRNFPSGTPGQ
jgi:hypothetical protein